MKSAILSLATVALLLATATDSDARPRRWRSNYAYSGVRVFPSINTSPYYWGNYYPSYYGGYYPRYYGGFYPSYVYPASGFGLTIGRPGFAITIGSGGYYPSWGYRGWGW